jgi:hypothetical protein
VVPATTAPVTGPSTTAPVTAPIAVKDEPIADKIEHVAAKANVGEAPTSEEHKSYAEKAAELGGAAIATLGAVVGTAAVAVEHAVGVDLSHSSPVSLQACGQPPDG